MQSNNYLDEKLRESLVREVDAYLSVPSASERQIRADAAQIVDTVLHAVRPDFFLREQGFRLDPYALPNTTQSVNPRWRDNLLQFARLLSEIQAGGGVSDEARAYILSEDGMDIGEAELNNLFARASVVFESYKREPQ